MTEYTFENLMFDLLNDEEKCRICLKKGTLKSIQSDYNNFKIYDMLQKVNCVLEPNTTKKICTKCLERLRTAYELTLNFDEATQYYENLNPYFNVSIEKNCKYEQTTLDKIKSEISGEYNPFFEPITPADNNLYNIKQNTANESSAVDKNKSFLSNECNSVYESTTPDYTYLSTFLDFSKQNSANESTTVITNDSYLSNKDNSSYELSTPDNSSFDFEQNSAYKQTTLDNSDLYFQYEQNSAYEQTTYDQNDPYFNIVSIVEQKTCDNTTSDFTFQQNSTYESSTLDKNNPYSDAIEQNSIYEQMAIDKSNPTLDEHDLYFNMEQNSFHDVTTVDKNISFNREQNSVYDGSTVDKNFFRDSFVCLEKMSPKYENIKNKTKVITSSKNLGKISRSKETAKIKKECPTLEENLKKDKNKPKIKISAKKEKISRSKKIPKIKKECPPLKENVKKDKKKPKIKTSVTKVERISRSKQIAKIKKDCPPLEESVKKDVNKSKIKTSVKKVEKISRSKQIDKIKKECPHLEENHKKDKNKTKIKTPAKKVDKVSRMKQLEEECSLSKENLKKDNNNTKIKIPTKNEKLSNLKMLEKILKENNPFLTGVECINTPISKQPRNKRTVKNKRGRPPSAENLMKNRILVVSPSAIQEVFHKQISAATLANKKNIFTITTSVLLCNTCDKLFLTESVLDAHECFGKGTVNLSLKKTEIQCGRCQRKFKNVFLLSNHVCFYLKCLKCKTLFKSNKDIEEHENENRC